MWSELVLAAEEAKEANGGGAGFMVLFIGLIYLFLKSGRKK